MLQLCSSPGTLSASFMKLSVLVRQVWARAKVNSLQCFCACHSLFQYLRTLP